MRPEHDDERMRDDSANVSVRLIKRATRRRIAVSKAEMIAAGATEETEGEHEWAGTEAIEPTFEPEDLLFLYDVSDTLRQCIDAMAHNVDGYGYRFEPAFDFEAEDAREQVAAALRLRRAQDGGGNSDIAPAEVEQTLARWRDEAQVERMRLKMFFESCCFESSFVELRRRTTIDKEAIGWGAWEILRDSKGRPNRFKRAAAQKLRLTRQSEAVEVTETVPTSVGVQRTVKVKRKFRLVLQREDYGQGAKTVYFKMWGDPRLINADDGKEYKSLDEMRQKRNEDDPRVATEILWFPLYHPGTPYGKVRWHGIIPQVKGSREAHENTLDYLENSAIPRAMLLVADGRLNSTSVQRLESFFKTLKGEAENRLVLVEAEQPRDRALEAHGKMTMQYVSLRDSQREDATFAKYIEANANALGSVFRIPSLLRGVTKDFNRATAVAALEYAEEQVFAPERDAFDWIINRRIMPALKARFWRFESRGPKKTDPEIVAKVTESFLKHGVLTPSDARPIAERTLALELGASSDWQRIPLQAWLAGFQPPPMKPLGPDDDEPTPPSAEPDEGEDLDDEGDEDVEAIARKMLVLKARLERAQAAQHARRIARSMEGEG